MHRHRIDTVRRKHAPAVVILGVMALTALPMCFLGSGIAVAQDQRVTDGYPSLGVIKGGRARVRTGPSANNFAFTHLDGGSRVIVHAIRGEWSEISLPPYRTIWIHGDYVAETKNDQGISEHRVRGTQVRLRGTAGTDHEPIGFAEPNMLLNLTGKRDSSGTWVEARAPFQARVFVHSSLIELGNRVRASELALLFRGLRPPGAPGGSTGNGAIAKKPDVEIEKLVPGSVSPRLERIFDAFRAEHAKKPVLWNFGSILAELATIEKTSEDLGEIRLAKELTAHIEGKLVPIQAEFAAAEKRQLAARRGVAAGQRMEKEITKAVHKESGPEAKYLAVGWVVGLGKHRKVEGTHMLKKGNRLLFYLKSDTIDLDRYVNKRIGIQGIKQEQPPESGAQLILVKSVEVLSH